MHVGYSEPNIIGVSGQPLSPIQVVQGPVEETILRIARKCHADMIAMPTAGRDGFLDALRGVRRSRSYGKHRARCLLYRSADICSSSPRWQTKRPRRRGSDTASVA